MAEKCKMIAFTKEEAGYLLNLIRNQQDVLMAEMKKANTKDTAEDEWQFAQQLKDIAKRCDECKANTKPLSKVFWFSSAVMWFGMASHRPLLTWAGWLGSIAILTRIGNNIHATIGKF